MLGSGHAIAPSHAERRGFHYEVVNYDLSSRSRRFKRVTGCNCECEPFSQSIIRKRKKAFDDESAEGREEEVMSRVDFEISMLGLLNYVFAS